MLHTARRFPMRTVRRTLTATVLASGLVLAGCSSDDSDTGSDDNTSSDSAAASAEESEVTIENMYGEATYNTNPETVVAIGTAVDNLLALGITPDVIVERGDDADADWKNPQLEDVERIPVSEDFPLEEVASHDPDLVVGDTYRIDEDTYNELSKVTNVLPGMDQDANWEPQLQALGEIYGLEDKAQQVIDDDEEAFAAVRDELPGLEGKTALTVQDRGGQFGVIADPENIANKFYSRLGMTLPASFTDGSLKIEGGRAQISYERVSDLAANFMGMYATEGMDKIRAIAGYDQLPQVESGAVVEDNKPIMAALNIPSSLSNAWLLEQLRDQLEIVDGEDAVDAE
ncbi:ABC transporter substrate-binding protein [Corynebacterium glyciniphilum]|uniref:ABC transporter substrate-binding protein n=1 Tax=Corynebacterium glyciniphilum TaxID=1404244 RepID=UPI00264CAE7B|nr:ABC transporter substrate-binding protein [Corynebacterium glyciniphilum]MDN5683067.1 ABC transporter substrate-binding protein [Corynebacterium glyciniphilum]MDN6706361.1 ABC transporter substrate-binding protein [Corynebacterium glyciniphilum]